MKKPLLFLLLNISTSLFTANAQRFSILKDINPGTGDGPYILSRANNININGTLYFSANDGVNGFELWKSNGTAAGTKLVQDINSGSGSSDPQSITDGNGKIFLTAVTEKYGRELYAAVNPKGRTETVKTTETTKELSAAGKFSAKVLSNPAPDYFTIITSTGSDANVSIRVMDALGRLVEEKRNVAANGLIRIGERYQTGIYYAEITQGNERVILTLNKAAE